ncbi:LppU/SCO3897 family protein [Saccharothrix hoggarensis]|uniref:Subtilisin inhibitor-like n=1 Tax=Saccharothrix hoggarensis TaxID=913853 RepID=A0ABW3QEX8_9PSEU
MSNEPSGPDAADDRVPATPGGAGTGEGRTGRAGMAGGGRKILLGVLLVVLAGLVVYGVRQLTGGPAAAEAGDCVSVAAETDDRTDVDVLDCSADEASFKVGKVLDEADAACPEEGLYTEVAPASGGDHKLCLLPNLAEGACYGPGEGPGFVKTECSGPATFKVTKVVPGAADLSVCPGSAGMSYPEPPVAYCVEPAQM